MKKEWKVSVRADIKELSEDEYDYLIELGKMADAIQDLYFNGCDTPEDNEVNAALGYAFANFVKASVDVLDLHIRKGVAWRVELCKQEQNKEKEE